MKKEIAVKFDDLEWLYSPNWEYFDYGNCKRHLQVIMPYSKKGLEKKYPVIFYITGAAWHKQEMYNDIPKLVELAKKGAAIVSIEVRESDIAIFPAQIEDIKNAMECVVEKITKFNLPFDIKEAYLMGHSSDAALSLYTALHNAVEQYKQTLDGPKYNVTFSDRNSVWQSGDTLYAENQYGRVYQDENGSGMLSLPAGSYTFTMQAQSGGVTGSVTVPEQTSVTAVLDRTDWLKADGFMLSSASKTEFDGSKLPVEKKTARELTAVLDDSFTGTLYAFWPYDTSVFPDASKLKLTAIYTPAGGTEPQQAEQALKSRTSGVDGVLAVGMQGNTVVYRADTQDAQGMTQYQDYTLTIRRDPTLKQLRVTEESGAPAALESFDESTRTYTWQVLSEQVTLALTPTAEGYTLFADGEDVTQTGGCTLSIDETEKSVSIEVRAGGEATQYTLVLKKTNSCTVRIPVESADVDLTVCDASGQIFKGVYVAAANQYRFTLVPGMQYTYTATKDTY